MTGRIQLRELTWVMLPTIVAGAYAIAVLPTHPGTPFMELAWYQQVGSVGMPLSLLWTLYRLLKLSPEKGVSGS